MNCLFCQQETVVRATDIPAPWSSQECKACNAVFWYLRDQITDYSFKVENYCVSFDIANSFEPFWIGDWTNDHRPRTIIKLDFLPDNITPTNFLQKLPTLLVFA